ncbi:MAG: MFS transporter [Candidatus Bathyarchaeota archaeon]|nr:MFS transporter [Candidatus Bathyarchaeota archaeon]
MIGISAAESALDRLLDWFSLRRNVAVMVVTVLVLTTGNQIWGKYVPKYIEYLGATAIIVGLYGSIEQLITALYQYPGGAISDKVGSKKALILFSAASILGYVLYYISQSWELFLVGTFFVLVWESMAQPAIFALIGETLPKSKRAMGFSVQSILRRVPIILAPPIGGYLIESLGIEYGMRIGFAVSIVMAVLAIVIQRTFYRKSKQEKPSRVSMGDLWRTMASGLKRLLLADILARLGSNMVKVYVVLYVLNILEAPPLQYGLMISIQMVASVLSYLPAAKLSDIHGRKPFVAATFLCFALFPLTLVLTPAAVLLPIAFIVNGLREIGEPARKALIVDLAESGQRGKTIGLYYLIRETVNTPASLIGGLLWSISPQTPFYLACLLGATGTAIFLRSTVQAQEPVPRKD